MHDLRYWIGFNRVYGIGPAKVRALIDHFGALDQAWHAAIFDLKEAGHVTILVYNTLGQMVTKVVDREMVAGRHDVTFDASSMASGLYMYSISVNGFSDLKKMVLIR